MNFNNLKSRIQIINYAATSRVDIDYKKYIKVTHLEKGVSVALPGHGDPLKIAADIYSIIHLLATLKDHLKNQLVKQGLNKNIVEREIDSSIHLQVLIDLVNQDKHGYPLTKHIRSFRNPVIEKMSYTLINNNNGKEVIVSIGINGEVDVLDGIPPSVALYASVNDGKGNLLFSFDELVETCYNKWFSIANTYNLI
jgi:hypothetical protein